MAEINLTQAEADALHKMQKLSVDNIEYDLPDSGGKISVPLISQDKKEQFLLDVSKRNINLKKATYQSRAREALVLVRLDFGVGHRNPDRQEIGDPHIHIYREGYGDKWAYDLPDGVFLDLNNKWQVLQDFMKYCNIIKVPNFRRGLFS